MQENYMLELGMEKICINPGLPSCRPAARSGTVDNLSRVSRQCVHVSQSVHKRGLSEAVTPTAVKPVIATRTRVVQRGKYLEDKPIICIGYGTYAFVSVQVWSNE